MNIKHLSLTILATTILFAGTASAKSMTKAAPAAPVSQNWDWSGFYAGANIGGDWSTAKTQTSTNFSSTGYFASTSVTSINSHGLKSLSDSDFTGGVQGGYNYQRGNFVYGAEVSLNSFHTKNNYSTGPITYPCCAGTAYTLQQSVSTDWMASILPRAGWAVSNPMLGNALFYVTGGLVATQLKYSEHFSDTFANAHESDDRSSFQPGWALGFGAEFALNNRWSIRPQYLYTDLGRVSSSSTNLSAYGPPTLKFPSNVYSHKAELTSNLLTIGLNYKF